MSSGAWQSPLPGRIARPPASQRNAREEYDADLFLTQLPPVPPQLASTAFGPLTRVGELTPRSLVLVRYKRVRLYAVRTPAARRLRLVRWNRRVRPQPSLPGVPVVPPAPPVETVGQVMPASTRVRLIVTDFRTLDPSSFDPAAERSWVELPHELDGTSLKTDATGWARPNVVYRPSLVLRSLEPSGPAFVTLWIRRSPDGLEYRRVVTYNVPDGVAQEIEAGRADSKSELADGFVDVTDVEEVSLGGVDPRAMAILDDRAGLR